MPEKKDQAGAGARGTARRRTRFSTRDSGSRFSRPLLAAMIVILAAGAYLFWPRGGGAPSGIGEQLTVVTADSSITAAPRSGTVEIQSEVKPLVPEKPGGTPSEPVRKPEPAQPEPEVVKPETKKPSAAPPPTTRPKPVAEQPAAAAPEPVRPRPSGSWAVQIGAYENETNAQRLVTKLAEKSVTAQIRAAGTSSGEIVYRVWIGWFRDRQEALDYAKQERHVIGDAYPVHR